MQHLYQQHQELAYSFEQMVSIGLVRACLTMAVEVERLTGLNWWRGLHQ
jgi:hypothetical protein